MLFIARAMQAVQTLVACHQRSRAAAPAAAAAARARWERLARRVEDHSIASSLHIACSNRRSVSCRHWNYALLALVMIAKACQAVF
jgi:hypothetical protein